jgi:hypothetical protein
MSAKTSYRLGDKIGGRYQVHKALMGGMGDWEALKKHPNIVRCFYMNILDNQPFMVLEWIAANSIFISLNPT